MNAPLPNELVHVLHEYERIQLSNGLKPNRAKPTPPNAIWSAKYRKM